MVRPCPRSLRGMQQADDHLKPIRLRPPTCDDAATLWQVARDGGLDLNSPYAYLLLCRDFTETCLVAEDAAGVVGFVTGYRPPRRPDVVFVWQVAVDPTARRQGVAGTLVNGLVASAEQRGARYLEATVTRSNQASQRLFESVAAEWSAPLSERTLFDADAFPGADHAAEILYRIGPLLPAHARAPNVGARA